MVNIRNVVLAILSATFLFACNDAGTLISNDAAMPSPEAGSDLRYDAADAGRAETIVPLLDATPDTASRDNASPDAPSPDAPSPDAPSPDAPSPDAPSPDGASPDGASPDGASPDGGSPDIGVDASIDRGAADASVDSVPHCIVTGTCDARLWDDVTLNMMAEALLSLRKANRPNDGRYNFAVITDTHISVIAGTRFNPFAGSTLEAVLEVAKDPALDLAFIVITGDLVDEGTLPNFDAYVDGVAAFMAETTIPVFSVPGNHDIGHANGTTTADRITRYMHRIGDPDFDFELEGSRFIVSNLANFAIHKTNGSHRSCDSFYSAYRSGGSFGDLSALASLLQDYRASHYGDAGAALDAFRWSVLDDQLVEVDAALGSAGTYHFGFVHVPLNEAYLVATSWDDDVDLSQYAKYAQSFASSGTAVFSGHTHNWYNRALGTSSTARNIGVDRCITDGSWALISVTPQQAQIRHCKAQPDCLTLVAPSTTLVP